MGGGESKSKPIDLNSVVKYNQGEISKLKATINNSQTGSITKQDTDGLYYGKDKINNLFTGKDEMPVVVPANGVNTTHFYTKNDIDNILMSRFGFIYPGPYVPKSETKDYYTGEQAKQRFVEDVGVDDFDYYNIAEYMDKFVEKKRSDVGALYNMGRSDMAVSYKDEKGNTKSGRGVDLGKFSMITYNDTKRRTIFGYFNNAELLNGFKNGNIITIKFSDNFTPFDDTKPFSADISEELRGENYISLGGIITVSSNPQIYLAGLSSNNMSIRSYHMGIGGPYVRIFLRVTGFAP